MPPEEWFPLEDKEKEKMEAPGNKWSHPEKMTLVYAFYKKPMAAKLSILERSAMPSQMKVVTMSAEVPRRLKATSLGVSREETEGILIRFMDDLAAMGSSLSWRTMVLKAALTGYCKVLKEEREGKTRRNRTGKCTLRKRRFMKLVGASEWFRLEQPEDTKELFVDEKSNVRKNRRKKDNRYIEANWFIPHTPGSTLRNNLTRME